MLKVGLTGGVACGKSTIGEMLVERGARLVRADDVAHRLMEPGQPVYEKVVQHFGAGIVHSDGSIDRQKLAAAAFAGGRVEELNRLVHPEVIAYQDRWMREIGEREPGAVVIVEAALILEAGVQDRFDKIITVTCRPEQKVERFARRQNMSQDEARREVERRSAAQRSDEDKIRAADYVIDNSGDIAAAAAQVDKVWQELKTLAEKNQCRP